MSYPAEKIISSMVWMGFVKINPQPIVLRDELMKKASVRVPQEKALVQPVKPKTISVLHASSVVTSCRVSQPSSSSSFVASRSSLLK